MRLSAIFAVMFFSAVTSVSIADPIEAIVGEWISPDGKSMQVVEREFDGNWLSTRMWFKVGEDWTLVAVGAMYRKPAVDHWISVTRTKKMGGIELFESTLVSRGGGRFESDNVSFMSDGSTMRTTEQWYIDKDRFDYKVFTNVDGKLSLWLEDSWIRVRD